MKSGNLEAHPRQLRDPSDRPRAPSDRLALSARGRFLLGRSGSELVEIVHSDGALACWQVGSTNEACDGSDP